jgi:hypothetical protein
MRVPRDASLADVRFVFDGKLAGILAVIAGQSGLTDDVRHADLFDTISVVKVTGRAKL